MKFLNLKTIFLVNSPIVLEMGCIDINSFSIDFNRPYDILILMKILESSPNLIVFIESLQKFRVLFDLKTTDLVTFYNNF
jgi:hypothetical protein